MRYLSLTLLLLLGACVGRHDPFFGRWEVERVNVEFDESKASPEMVRQFGEMEKGNVIEINKDSLLTFISDGDTLRGRCSLKGNSLYCDGELFGLYENGTIQTKSSTPLGIIEVIYRK